MTNIKLLGCIDPTDVEQIMKDANIDIDIVDDTIIECENETFLAGVLAALMYTIGD